MWPGAGKQEGPFSTRPFTGAIANGLWAAALPRGPTRGGLLQLAGARPPIVFFRLPCTDCPPAIPTHILFNNLSLLNYLLALPHHHPPPSTHLPLPTKAEMETMRKR